MKKQVIIDKGNLFFEKVTWDDSDNVIIPTDTIGFNTNDPHISIVGKDWLKESSFLIKDKTFPTCTYCKPSAKKTGIDRLTQCALLKSINISFTAAYCALGTTLFNIKSTYKIADYKFHVKFYDENNINFDSLIVAPDQLNYSGYMHISIPFYITVQVISQDGNSVVTGECIRTFRFLENLSVSNSLCLYPDPPAMDITIFAKPEGVSILYRSSSPRNANHIDIIHTTSGYNPHNIIHIEKDKKVSYMWNTALTFHRFNNSGAPSHYTIREDYRHEGNYLAILGLLHYDYTNGRTNSIFGKYG